MAQGARGGALTDGGPSDLSADAVARWDRNAAFWDEQMGGDGNEFHLTLIRPAVERLLGDVDGRHVLEIACGNGLFARRLAALGATVLATDGSPEMLARARAHGSSGIEYRLLDASDPAELSGLPESGFGAVVCNMALMDMAATEPLAAALPRLLDQGGRFVFSITHPCFNTSGVRLVRELEVVDGEPVERAGVVVTRYATAAVEEGIAIEGQPYKQLYFDRPLHALLEPFFAAGMVLDGIEEPAFPPGARSASMKWEMLPEIPPVLVCRLRRLSA
ncbi:MAG TPA: class I SAM-dependent methyltransferase [Gaiellales bacterium]|nr:class I SAM-dependent methyltransferase [Gaiellales bacterium]